jgi:hydrogenase nickel incorporation protein HypA/HybF
MHELSIALNIVELVEEYLPAEPCRVMAVDVRIGTMAGVVGEALSFAWGPATQGTRLAGSALRIAWEPAAGWCACCECERVIEDAQWLACPVCDTPILKLDRGREMQVISVEITDELPAAATETHVSSPPVNVGGV